MSYRGRYSIGAVDVIATVIGGESTARAILDGGGLVGTRSSERPPSGVPINFVDWPFQLPDPSLREHLRVVREHEPRYAVAPDVEPPFTLDDTIAVAAELDAYADTVIVVPKRVHPSDVPDAFRVGVPFREGFDTDLGVNTYPDYRGRPVHLLGGNTEDHFQLADRFRLDVRSVDSPQPLSWADWGRVFVAQTRAGDDVDWLLVQREIERDPAAEERIRGALESLPGVPDAARRDSLRQLLDREPVRDVVRDNPQRFMDLIGAEDTFVVEAEAATALGEPATNMRWLDLLGDRAARVEFSIRNIREAWRDRRVTIRRAVEPGRGPPPPAPPDLEEDVQEVAPGEFLTRAERVERFLDAAITEELGDVDGEPEVDLGEFDVD